MQARSMEDELCEWKDEVIKARHKFYELNYFTTVQLLELRRELGTLNDSSHTHTISPNVLALLQSISSKVNSDNVRDVVKNVVAPNSLLSPNLDKSSINGTVGDNTSHSGSAGKFSVGGCKPNLSLNDLSDEQKDIMAYVVHRLNCSRLLVLKAITSSPFGSGLATLKGKLDLALFVNSFLALKL